MAGPVDGLDAGPEPKRLTVSVSGELHGLDAIARTVAEAGRMGGRLVSERYGPEFYERIGKKGGSSTAEKYGPEFFGRIGRKGGQAVTEKYGSGHFERIGRKGGQKVADLIERAKSLESDKQAS